MSEGIKFYLVSVFIFMPFMLLTIRLIFKKTLLAKVGYVIVVVSVLSVLVTVFIRYNELPDVVGIPFRLLFILGGAFFLKKEGLMINSVTENLKKLSELDLDIKQVSIKKVRVTDLNEMRHSVLKLSEQLNRILFEIKQNMQSLMTMSEQLTELSEQVSTSSNEEAATTEEISTTIETLAENISTNIEKSENSREIINNSTKRLKNNIEVLSKTVDFVSRIAEESDIINEIATKTDILSINASIEAAKAGEYGRGFDVVAKEIRKLASISQEASDRIKKIANQGIASSKIASKTLERMSSEITSFSDMINEMAGLLRENYENIKNIKVSLQELSSISAQNSSVSEEMAASAQSLNENIEQFAFLIKRFKLNEKE